MTPSPGIYAAQLFLCREGAAYSDPNPGIVSRTTIPGANDAAWLVSIGKIEDFTIENKDEYTDIIVAAPGRRERFDHIKSMGAQDYTWTCQEFGPLSVEMLFGTSPLTTGSTQATPNSGGTKRFFLKAQVYDHENTLKFSLDSWGTLKIDGSVAFGKELVLPKVRFVGTYSPQASVGIQ